MLTPRPTALCRSTTPLLVEKLRSLAAPSVHRSRAVAAYIMSSQLDAYLTLYEQTQHHNAVRTGNPAYRTHVNSHARGHINAGGYGAGHGDAQQQQHPQHLRGSSTASSSSGAAAHPAAHKRGSSIASARGSIASSTASGKHPQNRTYQQRKASMLSSEATAAITAKQKPKKSLLVKTEAGFSRRVPANRAGATSGRGDAFESVSCNGHNRSSSINGGGGAQRGSPSHSPSQSISGVVFEPFGSPSPSHSHGMNLSPSASAARAHAIGAAMISPGGSRKLRGMYQNAAFSPQRFGTGGGGSGLSGSFAGGVSSPATPPHARRMDIASRLVQITYRSDAQVWEHHHMERREARCSFLTRKRIGRQNMQRWRLRRPPRNQHQVSSTSMDLALSHKPLRRLCRR